MARDIILNTEKRNPATNDCEKDSYNLSKKAFNGKTVENVRIGLKREFVEKDIIGKIFEQQSKLNFNGVYKFL